jgi:uncharacterized protein with FMN-binding domain
MPKRGVIASVLTTFALVLLINFKTPSQPALTGIGGPAGVVAPGRPAQASSGPVVDNPTPAPTDPNAGQSSQGGSGQSNAGQGTSQQATTSSGSKASGTFTGQTVSTPFGNVQVQVTLAKGKIVDVQPLQLPNDRMRSQMIAQYAAPVLRNEALQAQSAQIDLVSGATYTSEGYAQSLQSALDQAR